MLRYGIGCRKRQRVDVVALPFALRGLRETGARRRQQQQPGPMSSEITELRPLGASAADSTARQIADTSVSLFTGSTQRVPYFSHQHARLVSRPPAIRAFPMARRRSANGATALRIWPSQPYTISRDALSQWRAENVVTSIHILQPKNQPAYVSCLLASPSASFFLCLLAHLCTSIPSDASRQNSALLTFSCLRSAPPSLFLQVHPEAFSPSRPNVVQIHEYVRSLRIREAVP